jgi:hypothetical protein
VIGFGVKFGSGRRDGNLVPMLAAEIPDIENGEVAADGMSVTWKLKTGVQCQSPKAKSVAIMTEVAFGKK